MNTELEITMGLRIQHDDLVPVELTRLLGLEPHSSHRKGEKSAKPGRAAFPTGQWTFKPTKNRTLPFTEQLRLICKVVLQHRTQLDQLKNQGFYIDVFVGVFSDSSNVCVIAPPDELRILGSAGISLVVDIYTD